MNSFTDLPLLPEIQKNIATLGFTKPTEIQAKIVPLLLENYKQDVHAQAQTGTGKTLAFGLPLLQAIDQRLPQVQGLIMAPTRELVMQIYENLSEVSRNTGIAIVPVYGGMPIDRQIANIKRGAQIVVGTPGRINDHMRRRTLSLKNLKVLVLDEADIMLDMGFREEIDMILESMPQERNIWLFSATVLAGIKDLIDSHMHNVLSAKATGKSVVSSQVKQYYCVVPARQRVEAIVRFIQATPDFYGIIFCHTKILTSEVMERLASKGLRVNCLHGDMAQSLRNQVIKGFKNRDFNILVATDVAARGIDVSDLTHVLNFAIPEEHESYVHRIGRTGRAGKEGAAILFVGPNEMHRLKRLERSANSTLEAIQVPGLDVIINAKMGAISDFIEQSKHIDTKLAAANKALKEIVDSFSEQEVRGALVVALQDKFFKGVADEDFTPLKLEASTRPGSVGAPQQEICMDIGLEQEIEEQEVRNYLVDVCKLAPRELRKVRVLRNKTFICVPENKIQECMQAMRANPIRKKAPRLFLVEDIYRPAGSSRGGDRDGYRGGRSFERPMRRSHSGSKGRSNSEGKRRR